MLVFRCLGKAANLRFYRDAFFTALEAPWISRLIGFNRITHSKTSTFWDVWKALRQQSKTKKTNQYALGRLESKQNERPTEAAI